MEPRAEYRRDWTNASIAVPFSGDNRPGLHRPRRVQQGLQCDDRRPHLRHASFLACGPEAQDTKRSGDAGLGP